MPERSITLASRDSLLALAQTIEAAMRLEAAGFNPKITTMKTAGDLKLNAPLYAVAGQSSAKEGRAFFTRELDDALLSGRADAAVHSFKDLPTEKVHGIGDPVFFAEERGSDVLLLGENTAYRSEGSGLVIGTSSLRRIHQIKLIMPQAQTVTLRGNVITRLEKLRTRENGINAILIASAGLRRLTCFAEIPEKNYAHLLDAATLTHIRRELDRFAKSCQAREKILELPERYFPTAPGQGVLALQLSTEAEMRYANRVAEVFHEHKQIADRVMLERRIMSELMTGCHAPLGVSAIGGKERRIVACYSRNSTTDPVSFSDSVWLERQLDADSVAFAHEIKQPFEPVFWWGFKSPPDISGMRFQFVKAVEQTALDAVWSGQMPEAVFVASPRAAEWLAESKELKSLPIYAAGSETVQVIHSLIVNAQVEKNAGKGFATALMGLEHKSVRLLWLGSADGEQRARAIARDYPAVEFLAVYKNIPVVPAQLNTTPTALHVLTSAAAAEAFVRWNTEKITDHPVICTFGDSAAEVVARAGLTLYHISEAPDFMGLIRELRGDTTLLRERLKL